ncbi:hypothetical protein FQA47_002682 [Oryzias melastigma]|uniref:Uncharacterized protein n=1 Tax=Oryzias melastigma TaxID=30732 RepID=A0A834BWU1_ORYME|nr:hypothetical protein FQA47_002682 [Oryzias melastigma]
MYSFTSEIRSQPPTPRTHRGKRGGLLSFFLRGRKRRSEPRRQRGLSSSSPDVRLVTATPLGSLEPRWTPETSSPEGLESSPTHAGTRLIVFQQSCPPDVLYWHHLSFSRSSWESSVDGKTLKSGFLAVEQLLCGDCWWGVWWMFVEVWR